MDDVDGHRKFYDEYNAVMDLPAEYYLDTIKVVFQEHRLPNGTLGGARQAGAAAGHPQRRAVHDRRRTRRHLGQRPDAGRARPLHEHPESQAEAPDAPRAPATTASSAAVAGASRSRRRSATSSAPAPDRGRRGAAPLGDNRASPRPLPRAPDDRPRLLLPACRRDRRAAAADAVHEVRLRRLPPVRRGDRRAATRRSTSARRAAPRASRELAALLRRPTLPLNPANGVEKPLAVAVIDEALCIGCTLCIQACPVDCIVGAPTQMHTRDRVPVHRLRPVPAALPDGLHRDGSRAAAARLDARRRRRGAAPPRRAQRAPRHRAGPQRAAPRGEGRRQARRTGRARRPDARAGRPQEVRRRSRPRPRARPPRRLGIVHARPNEPRQAARDLRDAARR